MIASSQREQIGLPGKLQGLLSSPGFVVVVAFVLRMAFLYHYFHAFEENILRDQAQFGAETGAVAASIASGHGFSSPLYFFQTGPTAWFAPVYPYLLAGVFRLFGTYTYASNIAIRVINVAFSAFTCWPVFAIGAKAFGKRTGTAAAWMWALLPSAVNLPIDWVWDTALAGLWMAVLVAATLEIRGSKRMRWWIGYGALWAMGALINPSLLSTLPGLGLWAIWPPRGEWTRAVKLGLAALLMFVAGISPWVARNYLVFHQFVPMRSNFGLELWMGNNPDASDNCSCSPTPTAVPEEAAKFARMTEIPYMAEKRGEAESFIRTHPLDVARFAFHRFESTWLDLEDPPADVWKSGSFSVRTNVVLTCLFSLLSFMGVLFAYRAPNDSATAFASVMLLFPLVFYLTHTSQRYRYPIEPIMVVLTVYAVAYPLSGLIRRMHAIRYREVVGQAAR